MQRLRIKFSRGDEIKFISHLDITRLWERAFHRAQIQLAYSEGYNPHPKISLAAPLAVGITSEAELMDVFLAKTVSPHWFTAAVSQQLTPGIAVLGVYQAGITMPSLQSQVRFAEYRVEINQESEIGDIKTAISSLLSAEHLPWYHQRDTGLRSYDLRALINKLRLIDVSNSGCTIEMKLRCDSGGSGRPEQVAIALGFPHHPRVIHRTKLILAS
ncbi:TIGR03936 family radical SAM-associated protein [Chloroflexota bacterium]